MANRAADSPLRSYSAKITRRCSLDARTRPLVSKVTDTVGDNEGGLSAEELPAEIVDFIALITIIAMRDHTRGAWPDAYISTPLPAFCGVLRLWRPFSSKATISPSRMKLPVCLERVWTRLGNWVNWLPLRENNRTSLPCLITRQRYPSNLISYWQSFVLEIRTDQERVCIPWAQHTRAS